MAEEENQQYRRLADGTIELFADNNKVRKFSSKKLASIAGKALRNTQSVTPEEVRALAASVLSQAKIDKEPL